MREQHVEINYEGHIDENIIFKNGSVGYLYMAFSQQGTQF